MSFLEHAFLMAIVIFGCVAVILVFSHGLFGQELFR